MENDFSVSELFDIFLMSSYCCLKLCDFHSDLLQTWFRELHNLSLIAEISPEQMKWYYLLQAKYYLAVGQYQALIRQTDELRTIEPQLRHIRAIGIKHQYGMSCCILSLKRCRMQKQDRFTLPHLVFKCNKGSDFIFISYFFDFF